MPSAKGTPGLSVRLAKAAGSQLPVPHLDFSLILGLFLLGTVVVIAYVVSLYLHPHVMCRRCGGTGKVSGGFVFTYARSFCLKCGATGLVPRLGTRLLLDRGRSQPRGSW